ncbi:MAG: hypothetical protein NTV14_06495 [Coprothermobacterota bacterium]|nr:hypothetical protein [Coprothermobacterota bacterium]
MSSKFEQIEEKFLDAVFTLYSLDYDEEEGVVVIQLEDAEPLEIPAEEFLNADSEDLAERLANYTLEALEQGYDDEEEEGEEPEEDKERDEEEEGGQRRK